MENKTGKYIKYAIGEIVLVVIGILIALQINNWNENRKAKTYENKVYKQIYDDVISDSLGISNTINANEQAEVLMNRVLYDSIPLIAYDTITKENQIDFPYGIFLTTWYATFTNKKKGYELFKALNSTKTETDSLSFYIEYYYSSAFKNENYSENLKSTTFINLREYQQKDWFLDLMLKRKLNPSYVDYIKNSDDFKTRVYDYKIFSILNYTADLHEQQEIAERLKKKIKNRLSE
ncbi:MAG: hypothetical protein KDC67_16400 [Ignavibacteriae bacterium]|nr:hypothetical protein [Ignavibacteriota bacterium]